MFRTVFFGSPDFVEPVLELINEDPDYDLVGVVTQPAKAKGRNKALQDTPVGLWALDKGIALLKPHKSFEILEALESLNPDVMIVFAYGQILEKKFFEKWPKTIVNLHGSLLPLLRGAAPIQKALMEGFENTGVSLQVMRYELDAGDVIGQKTFSLEDCEDAKKAYDKMIVASKTLLKEDLKSYLKGEVQPKPQDETLSTYAYKITKEQAAIDFNQSATSIFNQVRGMSLGPVAQAWYKDKRVKLYKTQALKESCNKSPGEVAAVGSSYFDLATGEGTLRVLELQLEGKKRMSACDFLKGINLKEGEFFK